MFQLILSLSDGSRLTSWHYTIVFASSNGYSSLANLLHWQHNYHLLLTTTALGHMDSYSVPE